MIAPLSYEGPARSLVLALKLRSERAAARVLAAQMTTAVREHGLRASALTWVPGRRADIRRRGYDHAALLASHVAKDLGLPLLPLLHRTGSSLDQSGLGRIERWANVSKAFAARTTSGDIAVIDDLVTSGATASAVGAALGAMGASGVEVLAACRAGRPTEGGPG
ncbi:MAG: hypothetical protein QOH90_1168 [Actinomycetota bacterium]|nr:hypothetical protein [Actinomycetota bacterium]